MIRPAGIIPAMVTPFTENQTLDEAGLRVLVQRFIEQGVHGLFCLGTNGEFLMLNKQEKVRIAEIVVEEAAGRIPVYAGTGGISTDETITLTKEMERVGVDAVSVITPYFLTFSQDELTLHYQRIAASTNLPIILYNIPNQTGNSIQPQTAARLARESNIVGIKDSSGRMDVILQLLDAADESFAVLAGTDSLILPTLMAGGTGAIAATSNVLPRLVASIYNNWANGDLEAAQHAQDALRPLRNSFQLGTIPSALKEAMSQLGLPGGPARFPVKGLGESQKREVAKMIQAYIESGAIAKEEINVASFERTDR
ncbi:dihydrodipicolinate synthase family protein [Paenibacillus agaridevorans]|uniref:4-hydroxy-tetrahydrodipicolinate synthase n=1 Tax=Paenibacillus agaridevorans TaxID=171404 RepID=A0A2R5EYE6_9BACL|nr:4-hydroxy-tetrahydrodipicolinate synthase [Paenibacillus agaridevorans]GBG08374.1 dihydrodipicolinate synthase family protein [Paenibacillus agaridevorans]